MFFCISSVNAVYLGSNVALREGKREEWYTSIQDAMNECDLALLPVSADYLASRFIQEGEQPNLLRRREEMQLRVVPIIVRACTW